MKRSARLLLLSVGVWLLGAATSQAQPSIEHRDARCISPQSFTQFLARIRPPEGVRTAKLYFRSHLYPDFYYVDLSVDSGVYHGILPMPSAETSRVVYYIEAVDVGFNTARSPEFVVDVDDRCRPGPDAALFTGDEPGIVVGSTKTGLAALPPGFEAAGIGGFISAAGAIASAGGGGVGAAGIAIGAAAGAAAGVGVVVAQGGDEEPASTSAATSSVGTGGGATTTTVTGPATTTVPAGPTTTTTTAPPGTPTPTTTTGPASTSVPTTSSTTTTSIPLVACFTWSALGNCRVQLDSCSTPASAIASHTWRMLGPPPNLDIGSTKSFSFDFTPFDTRCTGGMAFNRPIRLTVADADGHSDQEQQNVEIVPAAAIKSVTEARVRVHLETAGAARVTVAVVDRPAQQVAAGVPQEIRAPLDSGSVELEARALGPGDDVLVVFELAPGLELGSVVLGRAESHGEGRIVFHLSEAGETIRFRVRTREDLTRRR